MAEAPMRDDDGAGGGGGAEEARRARPRKTGVHRGMYNPPRGCKIAEWRIVQFLEILSETSNISEAVRQTGIGSSTIYAMRARDPVFEERFRQALDNGVMDLKARAIEQGRFGETTVETQSENAAGGKVKTVVRDAALKALLAIDRIHGGTLTQHQAQKTAEQHAQDARAERVVIAALADTFRALMEEERAQRAAGTASASNLSREDAS